LSLDAPKNAGAREADLSSSVARNLQTGGCLQGRETPRIAIRPDLNDYSIGISLPKP
jgi:hypothetical protein